jgi:hypothetical protein
MAETAPHTEADRRLSLIEVARDGIFAGSIGAFVVAGAHWLADVLIGEPLRTPTVLGTLLMDGAAAARVVTPNLMVALQFTGLHLGVWVLLGLAGSTLISIVDTRPKLASIVFAGCAFVFINLLYVAEAFSVPALAPRHLWVGTLLGSAAVAAYLAWRHPKLASHIERVHLTETTRGEIDRALALEAAGSVAFEAAAARFPNSPLAQILEEKRGHVHILSSLAADLGLNRPEFTPQPAWKAATLDETLRAAIAHERELVDLYDRFLVVVPEPHIRDVFVRLRYHALGSTVARLEEALCPEE